jgi:hypothetical protein
MKCTICKSAAVLCVALLSGTACAQDAFAELPRVSGAYIKDYESFKLAANDADTLVRKPNSAAPEVKKSDFESSWLTGNKAHQYLGLATIAGAVLTGMAAPGETHCDASTPTCPQRETDGTHAKLAQATVALAAATVATGLISHWDDFHLEDGLTDPDNLHALLGTVGMLTMAFAVSQADDPYDSNDHAGKAIAGAVLMAAAIKITW